MLLSLRNLRQRQESDCLAACAAMLLQYFEIQVDYRRLLRILGTGEAGTPFPNLERLQALGLFVQVNSYGRLSIFESYIELGIPIIVAVRTWALPHWLSVDTEHAVVVVGLDEENVYLNDPFFADAPIPVKIDYFLSAWADRDEQYAIISLIEPG